MSRLIWRLWVVYMLLTVTFWLFDAEIHRALDWWNGLPDGTRTLVGAGVGTSLTALWLAATWLWRKCRGSGSRYEQWERLAAQFYDIADRDNKEPLPTSKKKVTVGRHNENLSFKEGTQPHHATETETLSRIAGKLLRKSKVPHQRWYWRPRDPRRRWFDFVLKSIKEINPKFADENIFDLTDEKYAYVYLDVFPFAAHLVCKHCASFEEIPKP